MRIDRDDPRYPVAFHHVAQPPRAIHIAGALATALPPAVAIVGTRNATPYGLRTAHAIAATCARAGVCVVSGLASGIDGAAHQGALDANGRTVAVLGTSLNVAYPRSHRALQQRIANEGLLLTEFAVGEGLHAGTFPRRNRLIAALAQLVVVIEAGTKSGALITVEHAQALGIRVAAVPGPIDASASQGTNQLLRDGADVITDPNDVLALLDIDSTPPATPLLDGDDATVWDALRTGSADIATLAMRCGLTTRHTAAAVSALEIAGLVQVDLLGAVHTTHNAVR